MKCPRILADRMVAAFPKRQLCASDLQIIQLSCDFYKDKSKGRFDVSHGNDDDHDDTNASFE